VRTGRPEDFLHAETFFVLYDDIFPLDVQEMKRTSILTGIVLAGYVVIMVFGDRCSETGEMACEALSGSERDYCYQNIAKTIGDSTLCDKDPARRASSLRTLPM
jgi:hypothetical protein